MDIFDKLPVQNELLLIIISVIIGLIIGAEREYRNKSAGLRTFILVCFGSCLFTILSIKIGVENPDRLAANIITGIDFWVPELSLKMTIKLEELLQPQQSGPQHHWECVSVLVMFISLSGFRCGNGYS